LARFLLEVDAGTAAGPHGKQHSNSLTGSPVAETCCTKTVLRSSRPLHAWNACMVGLDLASAAISSPMAHPALMGVLALSSLMSSVSSAELAPSARRSITRTRLLDAICETHVKPPLPCLPSTIEHAESRESTIPHKLILG
jgi:hypothetical protein